MPRAPRTIAASLTVLGLGVVLASCKPVITSSPPDGGDPQPTVTAVASSAGAPTVTPTSTQDTASPSATVSTPPAPTSAPAPVQTSRAPVIPPAPTKPPTSTKPPVMAPPPPAALSKTDEVVQLTNVERAKAGCGPLAAEARLTTAAQGHTSDMAQNNYFDHTSLDGRTMVDRIRATGFPLTAVGENIAAGTATAAATLQLWMNSPGHRANILNCAYNQIGVGYAEGGSYRYYWTQDFGKL